MNAVRSLADICSQVVLDFLVVVVVVVVAAAAAVVVEHKQALRGRSGAEEARGRRR